MKLINALSLGYVFAAALITLTSALPIERLDLAAREPAPNRLVMIRRDDDDVDNALSALFGRSLADELETREPIAPLAVAAASAAAPYVIKAAPKIIKAVPKVIKSIGKWFSSWWRRDVDDFDELVARFMNELNARSEDLEMRSIDEDLEAREPIAPLAVAAASAAAPYVIKAAPKIIKAAPKIIKKIGGWFKSLWGRDEDNFEELVARFVNELNARSEDLELRSIDEDLEAREPVAPLVAAAASVAAPYIIKAAPKIIKKIGGWFKSLWGRGDGDLEELFARFSDELSTLARRADDDDLNEALSGIAQAFQDAVKREFDVEL